ncbi:MAG: helix-turn-helix domain-containing protein [Nocardia sp.]|nr:helix-turn-helix domain-containing protein [Nocardia sp.]
MNDAVDGAAQVGEKLPRGVADDLHKGLRTTTAAESHGSERVRAATTPDEPRASAAGGDDPPAARPRRQAAQRTRSGDGDWPDTGHKRFGDWLWDARTRQGYSQARIGDGIGVTKSYIGQIERTSRVNRDTAQRLLRALDVPDDVQASVLGRYFGSAGGSTGKREFPDLDRHDFPNTWFRSARGSQGMTQAELAERASISQSALGMKERVRETAPRTDEMKISHELALRLLNGLSAPEHVISSVVAKFYRDAAP